MSTPENATVPCQRCGHLMDADAVQCDACGEFQRGGSARDGSGKLAHGLLQSHRGAGGGARRGLTAEGRRVPLRAIARWTAFAAAGLLVLSGACLAGAWLMDSLALQLMRSCTVAAFAAGAAVVVGVVTATGWAIVNGVANWLDRYHAESKARDRLRRAQEETKALLDEDAVKALRSTTKLPPKAAPVQWVAPPAPRPERPIPSQLTLVFSVMGIICGLLGVMMSLVPFFGVFAVIYPMVPAVVWTVLAWTLSYYEGSQKLLPSVSLSLIAVTLFIAWGQLMFIGATAEGIGNALNRHSQSLQWQNQPGVANPFATPGPAQQLQNVINTGLKSVPTPPPLVQPSVRTRQPVVRTPNAPTRRVTPRPTPYR